MATLTIIVPCYRNALNVHEAFEQLFAMEKKLPAGTAVEYVAVDDGSEDGTHAVLLEVRSSIPDRMVVIKLTRNVGVYNALLAAFARARGECITIFPPDLQEPVELIPKMFDYWRSGIPVVGLVRTERRDGLLDRIASMVFHRLVRVLMRHQIPAGGYGTGLMDRKVMEHLLRMGEKNSHTLLLVAWLGYPHMLIPYARVRRKKGRSGWSFKKKIKLFIDSTIAFSYFPIRAISFTGSLLGVLALTYTAVVLVSSFLGGDRPHGWSTLMMVILLTASFQMVALGVLGEYLWRTLDTVRNRPPFVVERIDDERTLQIDPASP